MLTLQQEQQLIIDAQDGDASAKLQLLAEYRPAIRGVIHDNPALDAEELEAELNMQFLETLERIDPNEYARVWALFGQNGVHAAVEQVSDGASGWDVPARTVRRVRAVDRRVQEGASLDEALATEHVHVQTYREVHDVLAGRPVSDYENEPERDRSQSIAEAEVALDAMEALQRSLSLIKFGFTDDIPSQFESRGWPDAEVAEKYSVQVLGESLVESGATVISRATVNREIRSGLDTARAAIYKYRAGE